MAKKHLVRACLALISAGTILIIVEIFFRLFLSHHLDIDKFKLIEGNFEYADKGEVIRPSPVVGYEFIPRSSNRINSFGMLDNERSLEKTKDTVRILFLGDSVTANGHIPEFLENQLNKDLSASKYEVWNCAVGGYQVSQYAKYLETKAISFKPDIVLIGLCLNDFSYSMPIVYKTSQGEFFEYYNAAPRLTRYFFNAFLFKISYLYRYAFYSLEGMLKRRESKQGQSFVESEGTFWMNRIEAFARQNHLPLYIFVYPYLMSLSQYTPEQRAQYDTMCAVLASLKMDYTDLVMLFRDKDLYKLRRANYMNDHIHPDSAGDALFASAIADVLGEKETELR